MDQITKKDFLAIQRDCKDGKWFLEGLTRYWEPYSNEERNGRGLSLFEMACCNDLLLKTQMVLRNMYQ